MSFCGKCGAEVENGAKFCPNCGEKMGQATDSGRVVVIGEDVADKAHSAAEKARQAAKKFNNTKDSTSEFDPSDILMNKTLAVISYLWFLSLIPLLTKSESPYAQYHARQGFNLFGLNVISSVVFWIVGLLHIPVIGSLGEAVIGIFAFFLMIIGIINAAQGKAKALPVIGGFDLWHLITGK